MTWCVQSEGVLQTEEFIYNTPVGEAKRFNNLDASCHPKMVWYMK